MFNARAAMEETYVFERTLEEMEEKWPEAIGALRERFARAVKVAGLKAPARVLAGATADKAVAAMSKYAD